MPRTDFNFAIETKAEEDGLASFGGIASTDDMDLVDDVIEAGAFGQINAGRVALLRDHDPRNVVGRWDVFEQDGKQLKVEGTIFTDIALGAETYKLMKRKALTGLSVGYRPKPGGVVYDEAKMSRRITKAILLETSIVSVPCNSKARILRVKDLNTRNRFVQWLQDNGFDEDQTKILMEKGADALLAHDPDRLEPDDKAAPSIAPYTDELGGLIATLKGRFSHA